MKFSGTGKTNSQEFGQIVSWNGKTKLDYYSSICNLINGTDGSLGKFVICLNLINVIHFKIKNLVPPFVTKKSMVRFFSPDICR